MVGQRGVGPKLQMMTVLEGRGTNRYHDDSLRPQDLLGAAPSQIIQPVTPHTWLVPRNSLRRSRNPNRNRKSNAEGAGPHDGSFSEADDAERLYTIATRRSTLHE
jgi:hypothetical protein